MSKEQYSTDSPSESHANISEDVIATSLPVRPGPYRSLSAKRPRDPSQRKSVQFNDVLIVHEVPSYDTMRSSNCDTYRSWAYTDATTPTSIVPSVYSTQILSPFHSSSSAAQKLHANRLSSALYSTPTTTAATLNRIPDWAIRPKTTKTWSTVEETNPTNENNPLWNPPIMIAQIPDERANKDATTATTKSNNQSTYSSPYMTHSQVTPAPQVSSSVFHNTDNTEERKHPYRSAMMPDNEHYRSLPFTYGPLSDSTATYTSMLNTHLIQSNHPSNEQPTSAHTRTARARSAALPSSANHSPTRVNDTVSITPLRSTATTLLPNGSTAPTRTVLRPTTIAFQCSQPVSTAAVMNTITGSPNVVTNSTGNNLGNTTLSTAPTNTAKPPTIPSRYGSSAAAAAAAHSRFISSPARTYPASSMASSAIKYAFAHPAMDLSSTNTTTPKPPPTAYPRSRSANVLNPRRTAASPIVMIDGHSNGGSTANPSTNLYATTKRNPNVRQTYGSYYMHRVLLPTTTN